MASPKCLLAQDLLVEDSKPFRGPIRLGEQFTLSIPRLTASPDSASLLTVAETKLDLGLSISNTINTKSGRFLVDSEDRSAVFRLEHGLVDGVQIGLELPLQWRGGGVLDSFIFDWHKFFSLPQGPRDDVQVSNDSFNVRGTDDEGDRFSLQNGGMAIGDIRLRAKASLFSNPALAASLELRLATVASRYSTHGVDILAAFHSSIPLFSSQNYLHSSVSYSWYSSSNYSGIDYEEHRGYASSYLEIPFAERYSAILGASLSSNMISNIPRFPRYQTYLDLGLVIEISERTELRMLVRENPAPEQGSSDFTAHLSLSHLL